MSEADYLAEAIRYIAEDMNAEDRRAFEQFLQSDPLKKREVDALQKLWEQTGHYREEAPPTNVSEQWSRFVGRAFQEDTTIRTLVPWWRKVGRIAAAILFLVGSLMAWKILQSPQQAQLEPVLVQADDQTQTIELPDGSTVTLNANSSVRYQADFSDRIIFLEGEAFFEVEHLETDASFTVKTTETTTTVLGTSFNVRAYLDDAEVSVDVLEGKVSFASTKSKETVTLLKDSAAKLLKQNHQIFKEQSLDGNRLYWKTRELSFTDDALSKILDDLSDAYGVAFEVEHKVVLDCTYRTSFNDESIEQVLEELAFGLNLEIKKKGDSQWLIQGLGCAPTQ